MINFIGYGFWVRTWSKCKTESETEGFLFKIHGQIKDNYDCLQVLISWWFDTKSIGFNAIEGTEIFL